MSALIATVFGILTIVQVARALFPRSRAGLGSLFFFGVIAGFKSAQEYEDAVWRSSERELVRSMATTVWNLSGHRRREVQAPQARVRVCAPLRDLLGDRPPGQLARALARLYGAGAKKLWPAADGVVHVSHEVENVDDADLDDHGRPVAVVERLPLRASHRRRRVLALRAERALGVAPQVANHLLRFRADPGRRPRAARVELAPVRTSSVTSFFLPFSVMNTCCNWNCPSKKNPVEPSCEVSRTRPFVVSSCCRSGRSGSPSAARTCR